MRYLIIVLSMLTISVKLQAQVAVVNGASFRAEQPVSPGSWVSAFGTFTNVGTVQNTALPLPKTLGGVTVTVDGIQAPLNFVSSTQINLVIPYATTAGLKDIVVNGPAGAVNGTVQVISAVPGLFTIANTGTPLEGALLNQDNSLNAQNRPAIRGQVIQLYATGHTTLNGQLADGAAAPATPLLKTQIDPQVFIGGVDCPVEFSGLAPNFAALWQINCRIPTLSFLSGKLPIQIFMNGVDSNEVYLYVAP